MRYVSLGVLAVVSVLAQPASAEVADPAVAEDAREVRNCVNLSMIRNTRVIDDKTIVFRMRGSDYYRNDLPNSCPRLGFNNSFTYSTSITQLCNVDIITVLENFGGRVQRGAACGLGKFHPISKEEFATLRAESKNKRKSKDKEVEQDQETSR